MSHQDLAAEIRDQGFAVIENAVSPQSLLTLQRAAQRIVDEFDVSAHRSVFSTLHEDRDRDHYFIESAEAVHCFLEEDALDQDGQLNRPKERAINKIGHAMHDLVPEFTEFCRLPVFSRLLASAGYEQPQLWQTMYIFKQPQIGGEVRWHQDASYLIAEPPGVIGIWVAVEDADRTNGCLWVQPGGHRSPLREIYRVTPGNAVGVLSTLDDTPWPERAAARPVEVAAGSVVMFTDRMPHYSSRNTSDKSRQAFTMHFAQSASAWAQENWLQRRELPPFIVD